MANVRMAEQLRDLKSLLSSGRGDINIAVAYVTKAGLGHIETELEQIARDESRQIRFLIGVDADGVTGPDAVKRLLEMAEGRDNVLVKAFVADGNETFHPKLFMAHSGNSISLLVGSYNLTESAFQDNLEYGLRVRCTTSDPIFRETLQAFNILWEDDRARLVDDNLARSYAEACQGKGKFGDRLASDEKGAWDKFKQDLTPVVPLPQWPSNELAYLLGIVYARGKFVPEKPRIQINLTFGPGGKFDLLGQAYNNADQIERVRERVIKEAVGLPYAKFFPSWKEANSHKFAPGLQVKVYPSAKRVVFVDFSPASPMFNIIYEAFNRDAGAARMPRGIRQIDTDLVFHFLRGYCLATATLDDSYMGEVRLDVAPKASGDPISSLIRNKTQAKPENKAFKGKVYIALGVEDFQRSIGFDEEWLDGLVATIVANTKSNTPPPATRRARRPTTRTSARG